MVVFSSFLIGLLFGLGLVISQMMNPEKVIGFLDITGDWDPTLAVVMAAALGVTFIGYRLTFVRKRALLGDEFHVPPKGKVTSSLIFGSALFGIGWGLAGFCTGPAIVAATVGGTNAILFIAAMLVGMLTHRLAGKIHAAGGHQTKGEACDPPTIARGD